MKRLYFVLLAICQFVITNAQLKYPVTRKVDTVTNYFGTMVADPYRRLEDDNSAETKTWVEAQNKVTFEYLNKIPFREKVKARLSEMWNYPRISSPDKEGAYYFFFKNDGLQNQSIMYRQKGLNGEAEVFMDPNKLSADGTAALGGTSFSKNSKYMAYTISQSGSDWQEIYVMDVETKQLLTDKVKFVKFSSPRWKGDEGFYYSRYAEPDEKSKLSNRINFTRFGIIKQVQHKVKMCWFIKMIHIHSGLSMPA